MRKVFFVLLFACNLGYSQTNISEIINTYTPVISFDSCENKITVEDASLFFAGDTCFNDTNEGGYDKFDQHSLFWRHYQL